MLLATGALAHGATAIVTTAGTVEVRVEDFQLRESPGGQWISERPNRFATELCYRIEKGGVSLTRKLPFTAIESIEFKTFVAKDAINPEVREVSIRLKDGGRVEWVHADRSVTVTSPAGEKEKWKSFPWISGFVSSGEQVQGQTFVLTGFAGFAAVGGERGKWEAEPPQIKRIRFVDGK